MKKAPDFCSFMQDELREYISFMIGNGRVFRVEVTILKEFDRYLQCAADQDITADCVNGFVHMKQNLTDGQYAKRHRIIRCFLEFRAIRGRGETVPIPPKARSSGRRQPYLYTQSDISQLFAQAKQLNPVDSLRPHTYQTIIGLLCCTGLRISEALNLDMNDVDLENSTIYIRCTKNGKSRYVPLHPTACTALRNYAEKRQRLFPTSQSKAFFLSNRGKGISYSVFNNTFLKLVRGLGIGGDDRNSRTHDLRHTFAVNRLLAWYEEGADVQDLLHLLSVYMGHTHFEDTTYYLNACAELMAKGAAAFKFTGCGGGGNA